MINRLENTTGIPAEKHNTHIQTSVDVRKRIRFVYQISNLIKNTPSSPKSKIGKHFA